MMQSADHKSLCIVRFFFFLWLLAWSVQQESSLYAWRRESFPRILIIIKYLCQCIMAALHLAGFITLRVEAGIISKILDHNQVFVPLYHGSLALSKIHHFTRGGGNHFQDDLCKVHCCAQRDLVHGHHVTSSWLPCSA